MDRLMVPHRILWRSAIVAAVLVAVGALDHGTERVSRQGGTTATLVEGAGHWAGVALLCGLLGIASLKRARGDGRWEATWLRVSALLFLIAAVDAGNHWVGLLRERAASPAYAVEIAGGLPITVTASVVGMVTVVMLLTSTLYNDPQRERSAATTGAESRSR